MESFRSDPELEVEEEAAAQTYLVRPTYMQEPIFQSLSQFKSNDETLMRNNSKTTDK